jgi:TldD protein
MGLGEYMETISNEHPRPFGVTLKQKIDANFHRQQKAFGNTEGQFVTQRLYRTGARVSFEVNTVEDGLGGGLAAGVLKQLNPFGAGAGFEALRNPQIRGWLRELYEELGQESLLPAIPVDVGKFDCLIHPDAVAQLIKKSIGVATEIDRVMGFEANTTGTSYITDPNEELGALKIGSSALNITATRSKPGGLMHMKWDDEGVAPKDVQLVKNGVLSNLQTGREGTAWMKGYLQKSGQPILSNGSVFGIDAHEPQSIHPSDLILHPDPSQDTTLGQLREHMSEGLEFKHGHVLMDFQQSTGMMVNYMAFQIKKGKRVARVVNPGALFRTSQLWGNMKALGGPGSSYCVGTGDFKSNPSRIAYSSVYAPPVLIKELSIINPAQKA